MDGELTHRQRQCVQLSVMMTDKEIARELGLSPHTVSLHIRAAMKKLGVGNRKAAQRAIAGNPLYASDAMAAADFAVSVGGVNGTVQQAVPRQDDDAPIPQEWWLLPTVLPPVPRSAVARLALVVMASVAFLIAGATLLGLMGIVVDVANGWAVDPHHS